MTKLSDTQSILLSTAAQRDTLSILPLPATAKASGSGKAFAALLKRGFAEERETTDPIAVHRTEGDLRYGVFATAAGLNAVGIESETDNAAAITPPAPAPKPPRTSKTDSVLALLRRQATVPRDGAHWVSANQDRTNEPKSLDQICEFAKLLPAVGARVSMGRQDGLD